VLVVRMEAGAWAGAAEGLIYVANKSKRVA
jgi:hypothetical protein